MWKNLYRGDYFNACNCATFIEMLKYIFVQIWPLMKGQGGHPLTWGFSIPQLSLGSDSLSKR